MRTETILLTGGTGFVGGWLGKSLLESGAKLRCLVRPGSSYGALSEAGAELAFGSLEDLPSLQKACEGCTVVFHVAGATKMKRPEDFFRVNVQGTRRVVQAASGLQSLEKFIYVSSLAACGPARGEAPLTEKDFPEPLSWYGRSKLNAEDLIRNTDLPWVIVRPPAVYGPGDRDMLSIFKLGSKGWFPSFGKAKRQVSLIHVKDLAAGLISAGKGEACETYFLADPRPYTWDEVAEALSSCLDRGLRRIPVWVPALYAGAFFSEWFGRIFSRPVIFNRDKLKEFTCAGWGCSAAKAKERVGFASAYNLITGFKETIDWYREAGWL